MANERHTDYRGWDVDSSTRQSVHPANRYVAISNAASTTAEDVYSIVVNGGEIATNLVLNPGVEGSTVDEFVATGSARSRSTAQAAEGSASLLINPDNSGNPRPAKNDNAMKAVYIGICDPKPPNPGFPANS